MTSIQEIILDFCSEMERATNEIPKEVVLSESQFFNLKIDYDSKNTYPEKNYYQHGDYSCFVLNTARGKVKIKKE